MEWLKKQWNEPSRSDYYMMQVAREVHCVLHKNPGQVKVGMFKIPFLFKKLVAVPQSVKERMVAHSKSFWGAILGKK
jgi:hypothetical protein